MQRVIRSSELVSKPTDELYSIDNVQSDAQPYNLKHVAIENYAFYKSQYFETNIYGCDIKVPVFVVPKDRDDFNKSENRKKADIIAEIKKLTTKMQTDEAAIILKKNFDRVKHAELLDFHYETTKKLAIQKALNEIEPANEAETSSQKE